MAKISARGATEIARLVRPYPDGGQHVYVYTSDGRVLSQVVHSDGTRAGYKIVARRVSEARLQWDLDRLQRNAGYRLA